jgi:hypothetical protein
VVVTIKGTYIFLVLTILMTDKVELKKILLNIIIEDCQEIKSIIKKMEDINQRRKVYDELTSISNNDRMIDQNICNGMMYVDNEGDVRIAFK